MGQSSSNREAATIFFRVGQNLCGKLSWQQYCLSTKQNIRLNKSLKITFFFNNNNISIYKIAPPNTFLTKQQVQLWAVSLPQKVGHAPRANSV